ncbi:hypothetical protein ASG49_16240 [Marmoricola sp. Leaf446]|uniref:hypothetical protein n=1 Tax=Marmoricola sp. Leaf446 TaxID=1736379 RepID=UPI0006FAA307|nr:hypothetical protein [Marmoricola sp. Leaf446]KQT89329.1 hypothetical protein ASG49_16240 [Marmoricola sp. Leaf446]
MHEAQRDQVAVHEAGHAVAYYVMGRPIKRAVVALSEHRVVPVERPRIGNPEEATVAASGWAAEKYWYRTTISDPQHAQDAINTAWLNLGASADEEAIERFAAEFDDVAEDEAWLLADELVARHWALVEAVAEALKAEAEFGQRRLTEIADSCGVPFGECTADSLRTGDDS